MIQVQTAISIHERDSKTHGSSASDPMMIVRTHPHRRGLVILKIPNDGRGGVELAVDASELSQALYSAKHAG